MRRKFHRRIALVLQYVEVMRWVFDFEGHSSIRRVKEPPRGAKRARAVENSTVIYRCDNIKFRPSLPQGNGFYSPSGVMRRRAPALQDIKMKRHSLVVCDENFSSLSPLCLFFSQSLTSGFRQAILQILARTIETITPKTGLASSQKFQKTQVNYSTAIV